MKLTECTARELTDNLARLVRVIDLQQPERLTAKDLQAIWPGLRLSVIEHAARELIHYTGPGGKDMVLWRAEVDELRVRWRMERELGLTTFAGGH